MKNLKLIKKSVAIFLLFIISLAWFSCSRTSEDYSINSNAIIHKDTTSHFKSSFEAASFTIIHLNADSLIVSKFVATSLYDSLLSTTNSTPDLTKAYELKFDDPRVDELFVPILSNDSIEKSLYSIFIPDSNTFIETYILEKVYLDSTTRLNYYYPNGELAISAEFNASNHVIDLSVNESPVYAPPGGLNCVVDCVTAALAACFADPICALECGYILEYCVSAITVACVWECYAKKPAPST